MANITITRDDATPFLIEFGKRLARPRDLMQVMGRRLGNVLRDHFAARDREPNKRGWPKQHFWGEIREATGVSEVTDTSATVTIADYRMAHKIKGGAIVAKQAKALTIPLHPLAYGKRASVLEAETGIDLFQPGKKGEKKGVLLGEYQGQLIAFYALRKRVNQPADPRALPPDEEINEAMTEEVSDWLDAQIEDSSAT